MNSTTVYVMLVICAATLNPIHLRVWRGTGRRSFARHPPSHQRRCTAGRTGFHYRRRCHHRARLAQHPPAQHGLACTAIGIPLGLML